MSDEKKVLTPQEEEGQISFLRGQSTSLQFRRKHPTFKANEANAKILGDYIKENKLEWTVGSLEEAFAALKDKLELNPEYTPAPPAPREEEEKPLPEWGLLTNQIIGAMPLDEYKKFYKNLEFRRQVENVRQGRSQFDE